mmetsp:Transcript_43480/g.105398  ORF Transcript_43480/g.105398 Transcript_43480/m.105398 type:complete len:761 (+) Transcript_43480:170-2452(+)
MVTAIFVVEPITEPTLRVGKKVLKNYNHRSQQEHLPERKSMRIAASTSPSSSSTSTSATATAAAGTTTTTTTTGKPSPEKTRCISTSSSTVSQDDAAETKQNQIMNQNQSPNKAQEKGTQNRNTSPTAPVRASVRARVRDVAATVAAKPAPETTSPAPIIRHNLLLGPTMMRQKRRQKQKERQAKADAMERRRLQEERRREEQEQQMVRSGLVSNMSNLQKTLARVSAMNKKKQKKQNKRSVGVSVKNVCDENEGTNSGSNDRTHSSLVMTERDVNDESSEHDVCAFDTKPRSRWVSASSFTDQASNNELFKYSNIRSTFFTHDNDNDDHLTSGCEEQQSRYQTLLPKGFTKWLKQKVTEDKEKQRQLSLNHPEKTTQRTSSMINVPKPETSDHEKEVMKRGQGRPKGSTNKKKEISVGNTAEEGERLRINIFDPQYYSTSTGLEPVSYPGCADREEQIITRSPISKQRSVSRSVNNEPTSPEERHKLAKELIARFEADDKQKMYPMDDDDDDDDDDSMNFAPFDFGDDDESDSDSDSNSVNENKDGRSSDESTKDCHVTESSKRQKMDPSTAGAETNQVGINANPLEDLLKPKVTIRSLLELAAGMASGNAMNLFYKRSIALDALMEAKDAPATVAALQYVKRFFGGVQVIPVVFKAIDEAEAKTLLSMQSTLAFHMMSHPMQGGLGWAQADTEKAILGLMPLLGSNLGLDPIDTMSLVSFGLPVSQAISIMPFLRKMEDDVFGEAVSLHSKMVGVSNR